MIRFTFGRVFVHHVPLRSAFLAATLAITASLASAQDATSKYTIQADRQEKVSENRQRLVGRVEIENGSTKLYADEAELFRDEDRVVATGNVAFSQGANTIAADRVDFNTKTRLGTFTNAYGIATIQPQRQRPTPGAIAVPTSSNMATDVYFFGATVEKLGPKKYKITNGGFSTCVQPTPRWDLHADTIILNIDHYTFLKQAVLNVKGVPMLYVPVMYYPTKEDGRATGFLLPTYGSSSLRGQSLHNAFFWAINRSQDATFMHDWYSQTGQALGTEYRYNLGTGAGTIRGQLVNDHETVYPNGSTLPASRSYEIVGNAFQTLPHNLRARANVDYFSSVTTMQTFNTNLADASRSWRTFGANVVGAWGSYLLNATFDRNENFSSTTSSVVSGNTPRVAVTRSDRPILRSPLYFSAGAEFVHFVRATHDDAAGTVDSGLTRVDFAPQVRYPFKRWQWLTANTTVLFRDTIYTRSVDQTTALVTNQALNRRYLTVQSQIVGPVFNRIWSTPDNHYAEKFKHTIEPFLTVSRTTSVDNVDRIVKTDGTDQVVGTTAYAYGLNNRLYAKRKIGLTSQAQEIVTLSVSQSYYTNNQAAQYDRSYQTSVAATRPTNFSPISVDLRAMPSTAISANVHGEVDSQYHELRLLNVNATYSLIGRVQAGVGWTHKYFIEGLPGFNDPTQLDHYLNFQSSAQTRDNHFGMRYSFNYDVLRSTLVQQTLVGFYNAQCCGVAFQYAPRNYGGALSSLGTNHSFFLSFSLAGLGNFAPMNGALGGVPR